MKTVLANGVFDILHLGHLLHLLEANLMGDRLIVSVTRDAFVGKGSDRPIFNEQERAQMLRELRCVDEVILVDSVIDAIETIRPSIFVKGPDYVNSVEPQHRDFCDRNGIEIRFTSGPKFSSTNLLRCHDRLRQG